MLRRKVINTVTILALLILAFLSLFYAIDWWLYAIIVFAWFLITLCGSFLIRWNYHYESIHANKDIQENLVALTFDDGPHPEFTPKILNLLKQFKVKATFFCIGQQIEKHPEIFKNILDAGHTVGNHTYSHSKSFGFFGTEKVLSELQRTNDLVQNLYGKQMIFYRPAFGVTNPSIEKAVRRLGKTSIGWNVRSLDTTPRNKKMVLNRITSKISKGDIVLLHDTSEKTVAVLEQLLLFLNRKELKSVTVDQLLQCNAYE